jgi:hypothetical protein
LQENGAYLAKHSIAEYLKVLVTSLLVEKPSDPFQWMREQLEGDLAKWASIGYMHIYI